MNQLNHLSGKRRIAVSSCLVGKRCRYDGAHKYHRRLDEVLTQFIADGGEVMSVCPEELGGLGTPRPAAVLIGGAGESVWQGSARVCQQATGMDVSMAFKIGANKALEQTKSCELAILKERSPSCGVHCVWSESDLIEGRGVFAALLSEHGIALASEMSLFGESNGVVDGQ
jgi:uncharacterized protein YbbK (DUF523 family)